MILIRFLVQQQHQEMQLVREKVYNMEQTHMALKAKWVVPFPTRWYTTDHNTDTMKKSHIYVASSKREEGIRVQQESVARHK